MSLSQRGLAVVLPQVQGEDLSRGISNMITAQRQQQALQLQQYRIMRDQEDRNAEFLADMIKQNRALTGTPYDEILNGKLNDIYVQYADKLARNPGMSKSDILMGLTRDLGDLSLFKQRTLDIKNAVEAEAETMGKRMKNFDAAKYKALMYNRIFRNPDGGFKRGSDLTPETVVKESQNVLYDRVEDLVRTTEGVESFVNSFKPEKLRGKKTYTNSKGGSTTDQFEITIPKGLYSVAEGGISQDGSVDPDKIVYNPLGIEQIKGDDRLYFDGLKLTKQKLIADGVSPMDITPEMIDKNMPAVLNGFIQQRAPVGRNKIEQQKEARIYSTTNIINGQAQSKPDVFTSVAEEQPWIVNKLPVIKDASGEEFYDVSAALSAPARSNTIKDDERVPYQKLLVNKRTKAIRAIDNDGQGVTYEYGTPEWNSFSSSMQGQEPFEKLSSSYEQSYNTKGQKPPKYRQSPIGVKRKPEPARQKWPWEQ